ncbi:hypothetical protein WR25_15607 [Diploscapter pachys]|uniref:AF4/FMR2 C-terminal homology domain-containing protein n=1 Tax=Diploscapter pachys TaxID=2018661 RepID=A0A2A2M029_9BILA|nr:hypothetical protein WR25_15607 [Diploscapter pachys]
MNSIDEAQIRSRLEDIFGRYNDFVSVVQNFRNGKNGVYGIVREGRPSSSRYNGSHRSVKAAGSGARSLPNGTSTGNYASSGLDSNDASRLPSPQQCLQSMQNLVNSPPLEHISAAPFISRDYRNLNPSSSTRSAPDEDAYKTKKRERNRDSSDTEPEREKRKRARLEEDERESKLRHEDQPAVVRLQRETSEDPAIKDLFEDDQFEEPNSNKPSTSVSRKNDQLQSGLPQLSPDSGIHSAENDNGEGDDSTNVGQKLELFISGLSPRGQLSPIRIKPVERLKAERDRKEEKRDKERSKSKKDKDETEKPHRKSEKSDDVSTKPPKNSEESKKKVKKEDESSKKSIVMPNETEKTKPEPIKMEETSTSKPPSEEKVKGQISLRTISPNLFKKLIDVGTKESKVIGAKDEKENKVKKIDVEEEKPAKKQKDKDSAKSSSKSSKQVDIKKEPKETVEIKETVSSKESPLMRPSSSASLPEFECQFACSKPFRKSQTREPPEACKSPKDQSEFYQGLARQLKKSGDAEPDKVLRNLFYIESGLYFCLSAKHAVDGSSASNNNPNSDNKSMAASMLKDTNAMLNLVQDNIRKFESQPVGGHFANRLFILSLLSMSAYNYQLYNLRADQTYRTFRHLQKIDDHFVTDLNAANQTPSPSSSKTDSGGKATKSTSSSSNVQLSTSDTTTVSVPKNSLLLLRQQNKQMNALMLSDRQWHDAHSRNNQLEDNFIKMVCSATSHFCPNGPIEDFASFLVTAIAWIRSEHAAERHMAPPAAPKPSTQNQNQNPSSTPKLTSSSK